MRKSIKSIFILIVVSLLLTLSMGQVGSIKSSIATNESNEDWDSYQPISDPLLNSSNYEILVDRTDNVHLFWNSRNNIARNSSIVHQILFNNGSKLITNVAFFENDSSNIYFDVDIDSNDLIHLIYYNYTTEMYVYLTGDNGSWTIKSEFEEDVLTNCIIVDSTNKIHFIYAAYNCEFFDKSYINNEWQEEQITNYEIDLVSGYALIHDLKITKSIQGKLALFYSYRTMNLVEEGENTDELHCLIYDQQQWGAPLVIAEQLVLAFDIAYDDTEKLHLIWGNSENSNEINYQTMMKNKLTTINQIALFEKAQSGFGYYTLLRVNLEIQGATIIIAYIVTEFLVTGYDYDLFLSYSNDGDTWTSMPIYTGNESRTHYPLVESTTEGDVFVIAYEKPINAEYNRTIYLGFYDELFTYQTTNVSMKYLMLFFIGAASFIVYKKKTRRKAP